jgi:hypothetical protein
VCDSPPIPTLRPSHVCHVPGCKLLHEKAFVTGGVGWGWGGGEGSRGASGEGGQAAARTYHSSQAEDILEVQGLSLTAGVGTGDAHDSPGA